MHLGAAVVLAVLLIGVFEVDGRAAVEDPHGLAAGEYERAEVLVEPGRAQGGLAGFLVQIEHAALVAGGG